ncbi:transcription elongation protein SprT [Lacihabitans sp. CCS-44]|uniref:SprT-like domain-containing protein n=1 Tax=Lacihabitans sp. CCS-44 TaxID=2487331 RepID=UPI0020CD7792|nr:SprT-like domain-containing protein [Lacihabitans sp. CCS-44]MCP9754414.1 transcription elongation protein SprT [Lacihabitans sp. CCS-44]
MFGFLKKKPESVVKTSSEKLEKLLSAKIPIASLPYVMNLWKTHPFNFSITKSRKSCLGNYRLKDGQHFITVNGDSNAYSFLVTLIHEIAHQHVALTAKLFRRKPAPHGVEWKTTFSNLMQPLLTEEVFPGEILKVLQKHMINPAASSTRDPSLVKVLGIFNEKENSDAPLLSEIPSGKIFVFNNKKYRKLENRRTRTLVECTSSKKKYTIASYAPIQIID